MAESQHTAGIRITGDGSDAVAAAGEVADSQKKLREEFGKTNDQAKRNAEESRRFVDGLKEQASTLGKTKTEIERYRASQLELTDAQKKSVDASLRQIEVYDRKQQQLQYVTRWASAAGVAIVALGVATAAAAKSAIDEADELNKLSQSLATSTEELSAYRYQMELAGVSNMEFAIGMRTLSQRVAEAQAGVGEGAEAFRVLGPAVADAARRGEPLAVLLPKIADSFAGFDDSTNKTATSLALFGRAGERLIPTLNQGAAGIAQARTEAERLGLIIDTQTARRAEEFNDNILRLTKSFESLKYELAGETLKALSDVAEAMARGAVEGGRLAAIWEGLKAAAPNVVPDVIAGTYRFGQRIVGYDPRALQAARDEQAAFEDSLAATPRFGRPKMGSPRGDEAARLAGIAETRAAADMAYAAGLRDTSLFEEEQLATRIKLEDSTERLAAIEKQRLDVYLQYAGALRNTNLWEEEQLATRIQSVEEIERETAAREELAKQQAQAAKRVADEAQRAWERTADNIERSLTDAIMRGGKNGLEYLQDALRTAILTPIIQPIVRPVAAAMTNMVQGMAGSMFGGAPGYAGGMFGGAGGFGGLGGHILNTGGIAGMGGGQLLADFGNYFGNIGAVTEAGGTFGFMDAVSGFVGSNPWVPYLGAGLQLMQGNVQGAALSAGLTYAGGALFGPIGAVGGAVLGGLLGGGDEGDATRSAGYVARFGQDPRWDAYSQARWFSGGEMGSALMGFSGQTAQREQNLIRNLNLTPAQVAAVNNALAGTYNTRYGFGMEHTPVEQSGAFEQIAAARLQAISQALGRSIEELTSIMSMSAEQWGATIEQMRTQLAAGEQSLRDAARGLRGQLGITGLEDFRNRLAVSEARSPLDRLASAREIYEETLGRATAGDLEAVRGFPQVAQQLLGIGRETYASGAGYQELFREVNQSLAGVLERQQQMQADILRDVPTTILEASNNQVDELRRGFKAMVEKLEAVRAELARLDLEAA